MGIKDRIDHNLRIIEGFKVFLDDDELGKSIENVCGRILGYFEDEEKLEGDREKALFLRKRFEKSFEEIGRDEINKGDDGDKEKNNKKEINKEKEINEEKEKKEKKEKVKFMGVSSDNVDFEEIERLKEVERKNKEKKKIEEYNKRLLKRFKDKKKLVEDKNIEENGKFNHGENLDFNLIDKKDIYFEIPAPPVKIVKKEILEEVKKKENLDFEDIDLLNFQDNKQTENISKKTEENKIVKINENFDFFCDTENENLKKPEKENFINNNNEKKIEIEKKEKVKNEKNKMITDLYDVNFLSSIVEEKKEDKNLDYLNFLSSKKLIVNTSDKRKNYEVINNF